jgi:hypothetical protein
MKRRKAMALAALLVAGISTSATSGADAAKPVFKVDTVVATAEAGAPHKLVIQAKGAVRSGGWEKPKLRVKEIVVPKPGEMIIVFVAIPPPPKTMVVQAVLPVQATITVPMPKDNVTTVKVSSETNSVSAKILR